MKSGCTLPFNGSHSVVLLLIVVWMSHCLLKLRPGNLLPAFQMIFSANGCLCCDQQPCALRWIPNHAIHLWPNPGVISSCLHCLLLWTDSSLFMSKSVALHQEGQVQGEMKTNMKLKLKEAHDSNWVMIEHNKYPEQFLK